MATNNQYYLEEILESLRELRSFMAEEFKRACLKTNPKLDQKVFICGYTEAEDCLCEATNSLNSLYQDIDGEDDMDLDVEEEGSCQTPLQIQPNDDSIVPETGDPEEFLAEMEDLSSSINQVHVESIHGKVISVPKNESSSLSLTNLIVKGEINAYKEKFHVANKMFNKILEQKGYIKSLDPDPPDDCDNEDNVDSVELREELVIKNICLEVACDDGCVQIYCISDSDQLIYNKSLPRVSGRALNVTWRADANKIYPGRSDGFIRCWDARTAREIYRITAGLGGLGSGSELCICSSLALRCGTLVSADSGGVVQFWDNQHVTPL